jgi:squalene-hopene/tetraprenyl-beta-curcumene cyclase
MLETSERKPGAASRDPDAPGDADAIASRLDLSATDALEQGLSAVHQLTGRWRSRTVVTRPASSEPEPERWLLAVPDVGPACEVVLADRLFHDLRRDELEGLLAFIRGSQDASGAWLDPRGRPDLSLTVLGWWARVVAGDDPKSESMVRAARIVHALGGAQRANFQVRLWMAMGGQIPWSFLPAIPSELFLVPPPVPFGPMSYSPWARGVLTPYLLIARAPARLQLPDASPLLLLRHDGELVAPRLTRHGLAGDLLQAFDRTVKLGRKLPRGPLPALAARRALAWIDAAQQEHGGWFSLRPTLLSLVALRVMGAASDDPRIRRGLDYLRACRGLARIHGGVRTGEIALAQGIGGPPLPIVARLMRADPHARDMAWLLRQELSDPGPWQARADAPAGGWPIETGSRSHLDLAATCSVLDALATLPASSSQVAPAWATTRRATDVIIAMQEASGAFSRFERGEAEVFMRRLPWTDADLLALGHQRDASHVRLTARALAQLGRTGFRIDDDRVARGIRWLERTVADEHTHRSVDTLAALARCCGTVCPPEHPLRRETERRLRTRQREDGGFGNLVDTARALVALLDLGTVCVQTTRAARFLVESIDRAGPELEHMGSVCDDGFGLNPDTFDPSAGAREAALALETFLARGGKLSPRSERPDAPTTHQAEIRS